MNILINGVGPHNKGAELMLLAILDQLRKRLPQARPVAQPGSGPYVWRARHGMFQLFDPERSGRLGWLRNHLLHQGYRERFGLVLPEEIDAILDASGYAFGDAWKPEHVEGAAAQLERYKKLGARIVLLPQAFGPFENPRIRTASARILAAADLVFARDTESLAHCQAIAPDHPSLHQAPDFTNLLEGVLPQYWEVDDKHVAFVPNRKMLTHAHPAVAQSYVSAMAQAVQQVAAAGYRPFVVVHEQHDPELARQIVNVSGIDCPIVNEPDPLAIKGILGACAFTIGSRFHGLVSALSQGVPSLGTAWSHKYRSLFLDYGVGDWAILDCGKLQEATQQINQLLITGGRDDRFSGLINCVVQQKKQVSEMWDAIVQYCQTTE